MAHRLMSAGPSQTGGLPCRTADEILGRDVVEFAAMAAGVEIALVRHFIIHHWHGLIIVQLA